MALVDERGRRFTWGGGIDPNWVAKIEMTTQPTNTQYAGKALDLTGMVITATKRDGTTENVTNKVICNRDKWGGAVPTTVTLGYHEKACYWTVTPTAIIPASMTIKTAPTKTAYKFGEDIDLTGAVLEVTYNDSHKADVAGTADGVSVSPTTMGADTASVTITYTEGDTSVTATQAVTLVEPESLAVKTPAEKLTYTAGEDVDTTGLVLTVTYTDESTADIDSGSQYHPKRFPLTQHQLLSHTQRAMSLSARAMTSPSRRADDGIQT